MDHIKKQFAEKEKKLDKANKQTNKLDNTTKDINQILDNLKSAKFNKNNMVISNEDIEKIKNFTKDVKDKEIYNLQGELSTKDKNNRKKNDTRF